MNPNIQDKNRKTARVALMTVAFMVGLSFAAVPLYRLFCQVTGFDGTTMIGGTAPGKVSERRITVLFDGRTDPGLPWHFKPETRKMTVNIGQQGLISFMGKNQSAGQTTGTALYNVTPLKAGKYFHKTQCFCFARQDLGPGKTTHFPVAFYIDPAILKDREMDDVTDIVLSYTFYAADSDALDTAMTQ